MKKIEVGDWIKIIPEDYYPTVRKVNSEANADGKVIRGPNSTNMVLVEIKKITKGEKG